MAQASAEIQDQEINLDELEVEILIIAKNPSSISSAAGFLNRRGWPTKVAKDISVAIDQISKSEVDFVLLSLNHPSPALLKLPMLLEQSFNVTPVAFVEATDKASAAKLTRSRISNKIIGSASGPNIHRTIRKILAEKYQIKENKDESAEPSTNSNGSGIVRVKGGTEVKTSTDGGTIIQKSAQLAHSPSRDSSDGQPEGEIQREDDVVSTGNYTLESARPRRKLKTLKAAQGEKTVNVSEGAADAPELSVSERERKAELLAEILRQSASDEVAGSESSEAAPSASPDSIFERALQEALTASCRSSLPLRNAVSQVSRVCVYPFDSGVSPGYLVATLATSSAEEESDFLAALEAKLRESLKALGVNGILESPFWLDIPPVDFDYWVNSSAKFKLSDLHQGSEAGLAFFPIESLPKMEHDKNDGMMAVSLGHIACDEPVTFKAYLHLRKNRRYYLYLRNGRSLEKKQRERLGQRGVEKLNIKPVDAQNLRVFVAAVHLRSTIKKATSAA